ncbi:MAG: Glu/Leu/Phe/Val dehydrogenase dimerization domain-containing protein [Phenylobacterium sp.]|jgi:leucine dehydrogenase|uniref:Glu/Leu/Phe/Val dehydrogenase dimerization domain-containing protein n=1 Tax=Phenylobacterium sp. TaxID=1871053 RepID=UPI002A27F160|nr:Glu/Leu/Phe/Val dehydrogenase dimerization domain-containing protein [Phenylobacterium sp.]MDD3838232.1 Glu/Leu/Phe/Val dehydrogenase dimerization domain-containing protein [Phenylobacterium sp.]MDX9997711.1 Glu/Leu/Phe/Val dehydrogenase dimerization domain-containing protein [Phenylobacterium sp.]
MTLFDSPAFEGHEGVHAFFDAGAGLKTIVAIHSTARGPAAGGCRMWPYASAEAALEDALRLSRAMSYKNAMADLELGGGKAVVIGDPRTAKTPALFEAFGAAVDSLGGRYWTAEDVGVSPADLAHARRRSAYVAGLDGHPAASGDPSPVTAESVFRGVKLCVARALGKELSQVRVAIQGVGHVGAILADKLHAAGARLVVADVNAAATLAVAERTGAEVVSTEAIFDVEADVFAPCALGGAISPKTLPRLKARVIAGSANNQLSGPEAGRALFENGLLYAPDYVINGGGIINVAGEIRALSLGEAFDPAWVAAKLDRLTVTLEEVLDRSLAERRPTHEVADEMARERLRRPA